MTKKSIHLLFGLMAALSIQAGPLQVEYVSSFVGNVCYYEPGAPMSVTGNFSLPGASGTGTVFSSYFPAIAAPSSSGGVSVFTYAVDLSGIQGTGHCVKLQIYFGTPETCGSGQVLVQTGASGVPVFSASDDFSTVTVQFGSSASPCLSTGQGSVGFALLSDQGSKKDHVTIIDDYVDPTTGNTNTAIIGVSALVPDIANCHCQPAPPWFQGIIYSNSMPVGQAPPSNGLYDLGMQLYAGAANGLPIGPMLTQTITVSNGLINAPMNFDPSVFIGGQRWLGLSVRPSRSSNNFTTLNPPMPVSPTPQAIYAYNAGTASHMDPSAAVTSLNNLSGTVTLVAGQNISIVNSNLVGTNQFIGTVTISAAISSDRNLKTEIMPADAQEVLSRLDKLPVASWRFKQEPEGIRHLGPMAQDFKELFGLGNDDKTIGIGDEGGVALTAIKALNAQLQEKDAKIKDLEQRLEKLEHAIAAEKASHEAKPFK